MQSYKNTDQMANDFNNRIKDIYGLLEIVGSGDTVLEIFEKVATSRYVFIYEKLSIEMLRDDNLYANSFRIVEKKFRNKLHLSKYGGGYVPYFIIFLAHCNPAIEKHFDLL